MADNFDINSILNQAYYSLDPSLLEGKQEYFKAITEAAITAIMSDPSLKVEDSNKMQGIKEMLKARGLDLPTLDAPKNVKIDSDVLLKLIMYLQLKTENKQSEIHQKRLDSEKTASKLRHADMKQKISKNLASMEEASRSSALTKAFGWLGVVLAIAVAIVVTVATAGAAAAPTAAGVGAAASTVAGSTGAAAGGAVVGGSIAGGTAGGVAAGTTAAAGAAAAATTSALTVKAMVMTWLSASIALTQQILGETGEMEKLNNEFAKWIQSAFGGDKAKADMWAQIVLGVAFMAAALGTGIGGAASSLPASVSSLAARFGTQISENVAKLSVFIGTSVLGLTSMSMQAYNIKVQYDSANSSADVTEAKAILALIQQMLEETEEELQEILEKIDGIIAKMFDIINSSVDTSKQIAMELGQMA